MNAIHAIYIKNLKSMGAIKLFTYECVHVGLPVCHPTDTHFCVVSPVDNSFL